VSGPAANIGPVLDDPLEGSLRVVHRLIQRGRHGAVHDHCDAGIGGEGEGSKGFIVCVWDDDNAVRGTWERASGAPRGVGVVEARRGGRLTVHGVVRAGRVVHVATFDTLALLQ